MRLSGPPRRGRIGTLAALVSLAALIGTSVAPVAAVGPGPGPGPGLTVTTTALPAGQVGTPYSAALDAINGVAPYSWTLISGTLPPGLSVLYSGLISGTPSSAGTTSGLVFQVADADGVKATSGPLSITIGPGLTVTTTVFPGAAARGATVLVVARGLRGTIARVAVCGTPARILLALGPAALFVVPSNAPLGPCRVTVFGSRGGSGSAAFTVETRRAALVSARQDIYVGSSVSRRLPTTT